MRRAKDKNRRIKLWFLNMKVSLPWHDEKVPELIEQGWRPYKVSADIAYMQRKIQGEKVSVSMTGKGYFSYPNGTFYGRVAYDDPIIAELGLIK
jgi:hypothetical protein